MYIFSVIHHSCECVVLRHINTERKAESVGVALVKSTPIKLVLQQNVIQWNPSLSYHELNTLSTAQSTKDQQSQS